MAMRLRPAGSGPTDDRFDDLEHVFGRRVGLVLVQLDQKLGVALALLSEQVELALLVAARRIHSDRPVRPESQRHVLVTYTRKYN